MSYPATMSEENVLSSTKEMARKMEAAYRRKWENGVDRYKVKVNRKYLKVFAERTDGNGGHVVAFVDRTNGDIYKPAGWNAPAKHVRGNVTENFGANALSGDGYTVRYL